MVNIKGLRCTELSDPTRVGRLSDKIHATHKFCIRAHNAVGRVFGP